MKYFYKNTKILFIGINPHFGSLSRGVPFSNNKLFWYLLAEAGLITEERTNLKDDKYLKDMYLHKFSTIYSLGLVNIIERPSKDISDLKKGEEALGVKKLQRIIKVHQPSIVCFIGKTTYLKFKKTEKFKYGWQISIEKSKIFVMHTPLRGKAIIRIKELQKLKRALVNIE